LALLVSASHGNLDVRVIGVVVNNGCPFQLRVEIALHAVEEFSRVGL
jgi:hypothetical protein